MKFKELLAERSTISQKDWDNAQRGKMVQLPFVAFEDYLNALSDFPYEHESHSEGGKHFDYQSYGYVLGDDGEVKDGEYLCVGYDVFKGSAYLFLFSNYKKP